LTSSGSGNNIGKACFKVSYGWHIEHNVQNQFSGLEWEFP
jgi:hypothetical protein